jgi:hypothetical protein
VKSLDSSSSRECWQAREWKEGLTVKLAEGGVELVEIEMGVVIDVIVGQHVRQGTLFGQLRKMFILKRLYNTEKKGRDEEK